MTHTPNQAPIEGCDTHKRFIPTCEECIAPPNQGDEMEKKEYKLEDGIGQSQVRTFMTAPTEEYRNGFMAGKEFQKTQSRAIPPPTESDVEAAEEYSNYPMSRKSQCRDQYDSYLAGCVRVRAILGEELEALRSMVKNHPELETKILNDNLAKEARIQELEKDVEHYKNQASFLQMRCSANEDQEIPALKKTIAAQELLLEKCEWALNEIESVSIAYGKDIAQRTIKELKERAR